MSLKENLISMSILILIKKGSNFQIIGGMFLNNLIPLIRRKMKIKQRDLAIALNVSPSYLCKVEKGLVKPTESFKKICADYFNENVDSIFPAEQIKKNILYSDSSTVNNVWAARKKKNLKQNKLAEQLECSPSYLSKIEKGKQVPTDKFKKKCARILKIKEAELFPGNQ
jgi:transcriptional regulator with XRE-family HTH domain